jgi:hypothetical protein
MPQARRGCRSCRNISGWIESESFAGGLALLAPLHRFGDAAQEPVFQRGRGRGRRGGRVPTRGSPAGPRLQRRRGPDPGRPGQPRQRGRAAPGPSPEHRPGDRPGSCRTSRGRRGHGARRCRGWPAGARGPCTRRVGACRGPSSERCPTVRGSTFCRGRSGTSCRRRVDRLRFLPASSWSWSPSAGWCGGATRPRKPSALIAPSTSSIAASSSASCSTRSAAGMASRNSASRANSRCARSPISAFCSSVAGSGPGLSSSARCHPSLIWTCRSFFAFFAHGAHFVSRVAPARQVDQLRFAGHHVDAAQRDRPHAHAVLGGEGLERVDRPGQGFADGA